MAKAPRSNLSLEDFIKTYGDKKGFVRKITEPLGPSIFLSSGVIPLDLAHGIGPEGGFRTGSIVRIMGAPGTGKSSMTYRMVANALLNGMSALIVDTEAKLNQPVLYSTLDSYGIDPNNPPMPLLYATQSNLREGGEKFTLEEVLPMANEWMKSSVISPNGALIVIDSVDSLAAAAQMEKELHEATVAITPKTLKNWTRIYKGTVVGTGSMWIFVHQAMANISPMAYEKEIFGGGYGIAHAADVEIVLKKIGKISVGSGDDREQLGDKIQFKIVKTAQGGNRHAVAVSQLRNDVGFDDAMDLITLGSLPASGVIKGTTWLTFPKEDGSEGRANGKEQLRELMYNDPELMKFLRGKIIESLRNVQPEIEEDDESIKATPENQEEIQF